jgi:D-cysteine desulfhydrase
MMQPALFIVHPKLRDHIPWIPILHQPTPTRQLHNLQDTLKSEEELWVKLDNLTSETYGGNKVRKLEFLIADALFQNKRQIATLGGLGTNHGLATTIHGKANNLKTRLYLTKQPITPHVLKNLKLLHHFGATMVYTPTRRIANLRFHLLDRLHQRRTYWLPVGGSTPLGALGYVNAVFELQNQIEAAKLPEPRWIFVPVGSFGTLAGLVLGIHLTGLATRVKGICVFPQPPSLKQVNQLIQRTLRLIQPDTAWSEALSSSRFELTTDYVGGGYGAPTKAGNEVTKLAKNLESLSLDSTYTAKTLASVLDAVRHGEKGPILYWHTFNSIDLSAIAKQVDYRDLPSVFHQFFEANFQKPS